MVVALIQRWGCSRHLDDGLEHLRYVTRFQDGLDRFRSDLPPVHAGYECFVQFSLRDNLTDGLLPLRNWDLLWRENRVKGN